MTGGRTLGWAVILCVVLGSGDMSAAGKTRTWEGASAEAFAIGTLEGAMIDGEGRVTLAPPFESLWGPEDGIVWDVAPDGGGGAFVALSGPGQVLRVPREGAREIWYATEHGELVTAIESDRNGGVWFGLSPSGLLLHASAPKEIDETLETGTEYVWSLLLTDDDDLWIGTGAPGKVLRRATGGKIEDLFDGGEDPVRCLAPAPDGKVIAGTGQRGRVIRFDRDGKKPFVLLDAEEDEVSDVAADDAGRVYALVASAPSAGTEKREPTTRSSGPSPSAVTVRVVASADEPEGEAEAVEPPKPSAPSRRPKPGKPGGGLYRIDPDGGAWRIWTSKDETPFALALDAEGMPMVATGDRGSVIRVDRDGKAVRLLRFPSNQATALTADADGRILIGGSSSARLAILGPGISKRGRYASAPYDAGSVATWGRVRWSADVPRGAGVEVRVRAGNTSEPDETWTAWQGVASADGESEGLAGVPPARWIQIEFGLEASKRSEAPLLRRFEVQFQPRNRPPRIRSLGIEPPGIAWWRIQQQSSVARGPRVADDPVAREAAEALVPGRHASAIRKAYEAGARTFTWEAEDPDGDDLTFSVEIRRDGDEHWHLLTTTIDETFFSWDSRGAPDGVYRIRLTADDGSDNAPDGRFTRLRVSDPFPVDNTPPSVGAVTVEPRDDGFEVRFVARDPGGRIAAVEFALEDGPWRSLNPVDGVADTDEESYRLRVGPATGGDGTRSLRIRATDVVGNVGGTLETLER